MNKNQMGFGVIEVLLIIVMSCLIFGSGLYVYFQNTHNKTTARNNTAPKLFTDPTNSYTFIYPGNWTVKTPRPIKDWSDGSQLTWISYPASKTPDPMNVSFDKTPQQAEEQTKLLEGYAKTDPNAYETIYINGYKTLHEHIEWTDNGVLLTREDRYLIIDKDQSSLYYIISSKLNDETGNYDATDRLPEFQAIVNSTKFL